MSNYDPIPLDEQTLVPSGALKAASRGIPLAAALQALSPDLRSRRHPVKTLRLRVFALNAPKVWVQDMGNKIGSRHR